MPLPSEINDEIYQDIINMGSSGETGAKERITSTLEIEESQPIKQKIHRSQQISSQNQHVFAQMSQKMPVKMPPILKSQQNQHIYKYYSVSEEMRLDPELEADLNRYYG